MGWAGIYDGSALPASASPAWTRTNSGGSPDTETVSGGILHVVANTAAVNIYYSLSETSPSTYDTGLVEAYYKTAFGKSAMACALTMKGRCAAQIDVTSSTSITCWFNNGTSWSSNTYTVADTTAAFHTYRIEYAYNAGSPTVKFYYDGVLKQTSSGAMATGATGNTIQMGDNYGAAASDSYWDYVSWSLGDQTIAVGQASETDSAQSVVNCGPETFDGLRLMLVGEPATASVRIFGALASTHAYRRYDTAGSVQESVVADSNGVVTFTGAAPGYIQGFTSNTYATPLSKQRWPSSGNRSDMALGNVLDTNTQRLGLTPLATNGSPYYPTSQYGGRGQILQTATHWFAIYRTGGTGVEQSSGTSTDGNLEIVRVDRTTGLVDQGPFVVRTGIRDGHEFFGIALSGTNKIRLIYGGYFANSADGPIYFSETTAAEDISSWTSPTIISGVSNPGPMRLGGGVYVTAADGTNHLVMNDLYNGDTWYGTATEAAPTSWTWTKLIAGNTDWGSSGIGDVAINDVNGRVGFVFGSFKRTGAYSSADYQNGYFLEFDGTTLRKADGTSAGSLPLTVNNTTGAISGADQVVSGSHYAWWHKLAYVSGVPYVLVDNAMTGLSSTPGVQSVAHWSGSSWVSNSIPDLPMWSSSPSVPPGDPLWNFFAFSWNWGVLLGAYNGTLYIHAAIGNLVNAYLDSGHSGPRMKRFSSTDGFATYNTFTVADGDTYTPFKYSELDDGSSRPAGAYGAGFCYPKSPANDPRTVLFSAVDELQSTLLLSYIPVVDVGQVTETDTALSITPATAITVAVGIATETDDGLSTTAVAGPITVTVGIATETDDGLSITPAGASQTITVGQATETDAALTANPAMPQTLAVGQASETDTALAATVVAGSAPGALLIVLPGTATFTSARSQTATFVSARSQTAEFTPGPDR